MWVLLGVCFAIMLLALLVEFGKWCMTLRPVARRQEYSTTASRLATELRHVARSAVFRPLAPFCQIFHVPFAWDLAAVCAQLGQTVTKLTCSPDLAASHIYFAKAQTPLQLQLPDRTWSHWAVMALADDVVVNGARVRRGTLLTSRAALPKVAGQMLALVLLSKVYVKTFI